MATVRLLTFNVRVGAVDDGPNNWAHRRDLVAETILAAGPEIVALQEPVRWQLDELLARLPGFDWLGAPRSAGGLAEFCPLLWRAKAMDLLEGGTAWLSETPQVFGSSSWNSSFPRVATWGRLRLRASGEELWAASVHLDHVSIPARENGARVLARLADEKSAGLPQLLLGDFNSHPGADATHAILREAGFRDTWLEAPERAGPEGTWCEWQPPGAIPAQRIDWILARGAARFTHAETIVQQRDGRFASDHFAVRATAELGD